MIEKDQITVCESMLRFILHSLLSPKVKTGTLNFKSIIIADYANPFYRGEEDLVHAIDREAGLEVVGAWAATEDSRWVTALAADREAAVAAASIRMVVVAVVTTSAVAEVEEIPTGSNNRIINRWEVATEKTLAEEEEGLAVADPHRLYLKIPRALLFV